MGADVGESFLKSLTEAEHSLRACGLNGRQAYVALVRHLADRLRLPERYWPAGPDAPEQAGLDRIPLAPDLDLFGLAYERFFPDLFKGRNGQYFTPRPLVELMADMAGVAPRDRVLDPTCGSGGFLLAALDRGAEVDGFEVEPDLVVLARLNLALRGATPRAVEQQDLFHAVPEQRWSVVLANPPFSVDIRDPEVLSRYELSRGRAALSSDLLFLEAAWKLLEPNGRLCAVMPHSILLNKRTAGVRRWLDERFVRRGVVTLPEGVFRPFGGTSTRACVLLLQKRPAQVDRQLVAEVRSPGFDPRRKAYLRQEPDELAELRLFLSGDSAYQRADWVDPDGPWAPRDVLRASSVGEGVSTVPLSELAELRGERVDPTKEPEQRFAEVDLADLDKATGEVAEARERLGAEFRPGQAKVRFREGQLLFGRMRPYLNNVGIASRPRAELPEQMVGSSEWVVLEAYEQPWFTLLALRSIFVREQLSTTGGQTRPRARVSDLPVARVPAPSEPVRERLDAAMASIHGRRLALRRALAEVETAYEAFGRGEIDEAELLARVESASD